MFKPVASLSSFSVDDLDEAKTFYTKTLELKLDDESMGLRFNLPGGGKVFVYPKEDHKPATYTTLNFVVKDIDAAVDELTKRGVKFERYKGMEFDERGIARSAKTGMGPDIAWFEDPAGNILSVMQA